MVAEHLSVSEINRELFGKYYFPSFQKLFYFSEELIGINFHGPEQGFSIPYLNIFVMQIFYLILFRQK